MTAFPASPARLRSALLEWFDAHRRALPWREAREPYRVWVSEIMLQQTRVEAVVEPYGRFLDRFPSVGALAAAREDDVLACWSGLGYYRRARSLHAGARHVVERLDGRFPETADEWREIPGVGPYTAAAVASIAFGAEEAAIDANVTRVVARLAGIAEADGAAARTAIARLAVSLVRGERPGDVNEALMDLGSSLCTARSAQCGACPLRSGCAAAATDDPASIPRTAARKAPRLVPLACALVIDEGRVLLLRRPSDAALLAGLWELPSVEEDDAATARTKLGELLRTAVGVAAALGDAEFEVRHEIVGRRIRAAVYVAETKSPRSLRGGEARFFSEEEMGAIGLSALPVKVLREWKKRRRSRGPEVRAATRT